MTSTEVVARARGCVGAQIEYRLGYGGRDPSANSPGTGSPPACDCSGFAAWCLGIDRFLPNNVHLLAGPASDHFTGWFETTEIYLQSCRHDGYMWGLRLAEVAPGDLLVWPDSHRVDRVHLGHVGVVVEVTENPPAGPGALRVVHCSVGNDRASGGASAIAETDGTLFMLSGARPVRAVWVRP